MNKAHFTIKDEAGRSAGAPSIVWVLSLSLSLYLSLSLSLCTRIHARAYGLIKELEKLDKESRVARRVYEQRVEKHKKIQVCFK